MWGRGFLPLLYVPAQPQFHALGAGEQEEWRKRGVEKQFHNSEWLSLSTEWWMPDLYVCILTDTIIKNVFLICSSKEVAVLIPILKNSSYLFLPCTSIVFVSFCMYEKKLISNFPLYESHVKGWWALWFHGNYILKCNQHGWATDFCSFLSRWWV